MPSDIKVFVRFHDQCVFAGEELKCTITFKNAAYLSEPQTPAHPRRRPSRVASIGYLARSDAQNANVRSEDPPLRVQKDAAVTVATGPSGDDQHSQSLNSTRQARPNHKQQRSVSIISIASPVLSPGPHSAGLPPKPSLGHKRSSTVQVPGK
jgi:RAB6A-GEF complex partner protein 2